MTSFAAPDGTRLSYEELGSGPPLVCWPGGPGRSSAYLEDLGGLSADRTLVVLDPRATGRSELPTDPSTLAFDRLAGDLEALREHLGQERLDVLAHSAGTLVAQAWAAGSPERVGALVLVTPSGRLQGSAHGDVPGLVAARSGEPWYAEAREAFDALEDAPAAARGALLRAVRPFLYGRWDARCQAHAASADSQTNRRAELGFRSEGVDGAALVGRLRAVTAPVLVVAGAMDALTGVAAAHDVAACFPDARTVVLPGAGHFPWVDQPAAFAAPVAGFLARR